MSEEKTIKVNDLLQAMNAFKVGQFKAKNGNGSYLRLITADGKRVFLNCNRYAHEDGSVSYRWEVGDEMEPQAAPAQKDAVAVAA